ncbi:MAG: pseudoazurin [Pseudomonadota bacterium]
MAYYTTRRSFLLVSSAAIALPALPALADGHAHTVEMLNKHPDDSKLRNVFYPRVLAVQPGETVLFKATDRGHNAASEDGMQPEGVEDWDGGMNKDAVITFDKPGIYGYKCTPHAAVGMVGLVVVEGEGKLDNLEAAQGVRQRGKAKQVWEEIWAEAEEMGLLEPTSS